MFQELHCESGIAIFVWKVTYLTTLQQNHFFDKIQPTMFFKDGRGGVWYFNEYIPPWILSYFQVCLYILDLLRSVAAHKIKFGFLCVLIGNSIEWKSINIRVKLLSKHTDLTYTWVISLSHRIGSIEPSLTRTGVSQAGTCRMKVLSAATFMLKCTMGWKKEKICFP